MSAQFLVAGYFCALLLAAVGCSVDDGLESYELYSIDPATGAARFVRSFR